MQQMGLGSMMSEGDDRVKKLQEVAWSLQSLSNKPGGRCPEKFKRECYKLSSRAISLCTDVAYTEESDFVERAAEFTRLILAKKEEVLAVEEEEKQKVTGKCFRAAGGNNYSVGDIADKAAAARAEAESDRGTSLSSSAGGERSLTKEEVVAKCQEDPEVLFLCGIGFGDGDVDALISGLRSSGKELTELDVSCNSIADIGVQKLVSALAGGLCPKLKDLGIGGNIFGDLGKQMLMGGLATLRRDLTVHLATVREEKSLEERGGNSQADKAVSTAAASEESPAETSTVPSCGEDLAEAAVPTAAASEEKSSVDKSTSLSPPASASHEPSSTPAPTGTVAAANKADAQVEVMTSGAVRAIVPLPAGLSAADVELDVSSSRLRVHTQKLDAFLVDVPLPVATDADSAQAVFSSKRRTLTITLSPAAAASSS